MKQQPSLTISYTNALRGAAICAVIGLHILYTLPPRLYASSLSMVGLLLVDQVFRFCVPLFLAVSGYGLMVRYSQRPVSLLDFYTKRVIRLLPLYLLWAAFSIGLGLLIPTWSQGITWNAIGQRLLFGQIDYHLYFVPMVLQLYLLFPLLREFVRRVPRAAVVGAILLQAGTYWWYATYPQSGKPFLDFSTDQGQYFLFTAWISYFVLGMSLAVKPVSRWLTRVSGILMVIGYCVMMIQTLSTYSATHDVIAAVRFTRFTVMGFGLAWIVFWLSTERWIPRLFAPIGKQSYLLYLSHPILLRILAGILIVPLPLSFMGLAAVGWIGMVWLSDRIER